MNDEPILMVTDGIEVRIRFRAIQAGEEIPCLTRDGRRLDGWPVLIPLGKSNGGPPLTEEILGPYLHAQWRLWRDQTLEQVEQRLAQMPLPPAVNGASEDTVPREPAAALKE